MNKNHFMKRIIFTLLFLLFTCHSFAQYTTLYNFDEISGDRPYGKLISDGTYLYGATYQGGTSGLGAIFKILPNGTNYTKLFDFNGTSDGKNPIGALFHSNGYLYGLTLWGGNKNRGVIYKIDISGNNFQVLKNFQDTPDGRLPYGGLISDGTKLYGTSISGGIYGWGTVFSLEKDGSNYTILKNFNDDGNGRNPVGILIMEGNYLYGTTEAGGTNDVGTVYKIDTNNNEYSVLASFDKIPSGAVPQGGLVSHGNSFYGVTSLGGINNDGTIFKINKDGSELIKIFDFDKITTGSRSSYVELVIKDGFLYGTASDGGANDDGTLFKIGIDGNGFTNLWNFDHLDESGANGAYPTCGLYYDGTYFYGLAAEGGTIGQGTIFRFKDATTTGLISKKNEIGFYIYPNPAKNTCSVKIENPNISISNIEIYNAKGELIASPNIQPIINNIFNIDLSGFTKGIYFLNIKSEGTIQTKSFLVLD